MFVSQFECYLNSSLVEMWHISQRMNLLFMETCKKQTLYYDEVCVSIDWVPMWEESLCSSAWKREKRNMKCFPGSSVPSRGHKTYQQDTYCFQWLKAAGRCPLLNLTWDGIILGCWGSPGPDAIVSRAVLVGRGCISSPLSPISVYWTSPRQTYRSHRLSWSSSEKGSSATLNLHGWLQSAPIWPSYQLLFQDISSS